MSRRELVLFYKLVQAFLAILGRASNAQAIDTPTEFIVPLLGHGSAADFTMILVNPNIFEIQVSGTQNGTLLYTITVGSLASERKTILFDAEKLFNGSEIANKSIAVSSNQFFSLQVITSTNNTHKEGFMAIPTSFLGNEYYVSTFCALGGFCQIAVASSKSGVTRVYVKLPSDVDDVVLCIGVIFWRSKYDTTISLAYPEVLQIETTRDMTGTHIYTDKPVSVVVGTRSMESSYHFSEQLVPVVEWGTKFMFKSLGNSSYGNIIHITCSKRNTVIKMSGYPIVELSNAGQSIRRRIDLGVIGFIESTQPVQVMLYKGLLYDRQDRGTSPGMTLIPAMQHFRNNYTIACDIGSTSAFVQFISDPGATLFANNYSQAATYTHMSYEDSFDVKELKLFQSNTFYLEAYLPGNSYTSVSFGGVMTCEDASVFPLAPMFLKKTACTADLDSMTPGDDLDNDCDGEVDEDVCYENKRIDSTFTSNFGIPILPETVNITKFLLIKLRIMTCGSVLVELEAASNTDNNTSSDSGKLAIQITHSSIFVYECFPNCSSHQYQNISQYQSDLNCTRDVSFFWMRQTGSQLCMGTGPFPPHDCSLAQLYHQLPEPLLKMKLSGVLSNATFWYDVYLSDCSKLDSDWRCEDMIPNCHDYGYDLCTNPTYATWVSQNCKKYCGICSPDSFGKMFVLGLPHNTNALGTTLDYVVVSIARRDGSIRGTGITTFEKVIATHEKEANTDDSDYTHAHVYGEISNTNLNVFAEEDIFIFSDVEAIVQITAYYLPLKQTCKFNVQPLDAIGTEYMTLYFTGDITCTIMAPEGPADVWKISKYSSSYLGTIYPGKGISINLTSEETTGTLFRASRNVAVFCGSSLTWRQLQAINTWGSEYKTPAFNESDMDSSLRTKIRILTNSNNTVVKLNGSFDAVFALHERGDFVDQEIDALVNYYISSNNPVHVGIFYYNPSDPETDYDFLILPTVSNFMDSPVIYTTIDYTWTLELSVTNQTAYDEPFRLSSLDLLTFYSEGVYNTSYTVSRSVTNITGITGYEMAISTTYFKDLSQEFVCTISDGSPGNRVDDDCDGLIDEENVCYTGYGIIQKDYDIDGAFGEDCSSEMIGSQTVSPPSEPKCDEDLVPGLGCWRPCQCLCSWVENLELYRNMTDEERQAAYQIDIDMYRELLKVEKENLSSNTATRKSAEDHRQSSTNIGYVGILIMVLVLGMIVTMDVITLVKYLQDRRRDNVNRSK